MKFTTQQLYGVDPSAFIHLNYIDALLFKYAAARKMVYQALEVHYTIRTDDWMDSHSACNHNRDLLVEALGLDEANARIQAIINQQ